MNERDNGARYTSIEDETIRVDVRTGEMLASNAIKHLQFRAALKGKGMTISDVFGEFNSTDGESVAKMLSQNVLRSIDGIAGRKVTNDVIESSIRFVQEDSSNGLNGNAPKVLARLQELSDPENLSSILNPDRNGDSRGEHLASHGELIKVS